MTKPTYFLELRAEEVQELLARPAHWMLRWSSTLALLVIGMVGGGAYLIHYPDLVRASFKLTALNAPKAVLARTDGRLVRLLAHEGETVRAGQPLAYLESTAHHDEVLRLDAQLKRAWSLASGGRLEQLERLDLTRYHPLGELQTAYQTFGQVLIGLQAYLANGFYSQKRILLQGEIADLQALAQSLRDQQQLQRRDVQLAEEDFAVQRQLAGEKIIAPLELKREESKVLARRLPHQQTASALISNLTAQRTKQREILELDRQVAEERNKFLQALNTLQSAVESWKLRYVPVAPTGGRVFFPRTLQENQSVATGQELFYVAPKTTQYLGELFVPQRNAGKVAVGQSVLVKFAGYPYQEYGIVRGRITSIAPIALGDSVFLARVVLPQGLRTTHGQVLAQKTGMAATAEIVTKDTRLLEKLFYQLSGALR